jgi:hypothetical protein
MKKLYSVTLRIDGRNIETKPFKAENSAQAISMAELKGKTDFPKAEEVDAINVEMCENDFSKK